MKKFLLATLIFPGFTYGQGLGTNLTSVQDYSPAKAFCDAAKSARCYGSPDKSYDCKFGDKIPNEPFGVFVYTDIPDTAGVYKISYDGAATFSSSGKIQNLVVSGSKTTAEIVMGTNPLTLKFSGPVSNISIIRPNCTGTFNPQYLEFLKPYSTLRFMDWLRMNGSPIKTWAERKLPTELQTGVRGVALEYVAEIANMTGKDVWVNVPMLADANYAKQMAWLLKDRLDPKLKIYVELSNEIWNTAFGFSQGNENHELAKAEVAAGAVDLCMGDCSTDTNTWYWARRRVAKKTLELSKIYREVFGDAAMGSRIRVILAGHAADHSKIRAAVMYLEKYVGKDEIKKHIYGLSIAPYFATKDHLLTVTTPATPGDPTAVPPIPPTPAKTTTTLKPDATIDTVINGSQNSVNSLHTKYWTFRKDWDGKSQDVNHFEYAKYYGLKLTLYECGQHLDNKVGADLVKSAKLDPKFKTLYKDYFTKYFLSNPGGLALQFADVGQWNPGFGATYDLKVETPQTQALKEVAAAVNIIVPQPEHCVAEKAEINSLKGIVATQENSLKGISAELAATKDYLAKSGEALRMCVSERDLSAAAQLALEKKISEAIEILK